MDTTSNILVLLKYIFLGLFQGITEPLPISSSGHLVILRKIMDLDIEGLSFEILVNFGSLIAVLIVFRHDIILLLRNGLGYLLTRETHLKGDFLYIVFLITATIPTGIIGLLLEDYIGEKLSGAAVVGVTLLITGVALWVIRNLTGYKRDKDITVSDALIVGLAQSIALVPGISRSGATIVAAMLVGMKRDTALRFSFLLYIPVSLGVSVLSIGDIIKEKQFEIIPNLLAFLAAILASFYALKWFITITKQGNLHYFTFYCLIVGIAVLIFL